MKAQAGPSLWSGWNAGELVAFGDLCLDLSQRRASTKKLLPPALRCKHPICTLHSAPTSASPADGCLAGTLSPHSAHGTGLCSPSWGQSVPSLSKKDRHGRHYEGGPYRHARERSELWNLCRLFFAIPGTRKEEECFCLFNKSGSKIIRKSFFYI